MNIERIPTRISTQVTEPSPVPIPVPSQPPGGRPTRPDSMFYLSLAPKQDVCRCLKTTVMQIRNSPYCERPPNSATPYGVPLESYLNIPSKYPAPACDPQQSRWPTALALRDTAGEGFSSLAPDALLRLREKVADHVEHAQIRKLKDMPHLLHGLANRCRQGCALMPAEEIIHLFKGMQSESQSPLTLEKLINITRHHDRDTLLSRVREDVESFRLKDEFIPAIIDYYAITGLDCRAQLHVLTEMDNMPEGLQAIFAGRLASSHVLVHADVEACGDKDSELYRYGYISGLQNAFRDWQRHSRCNAEKDFWAPRIERLKAELRGEIYATDATAAPEPPPDSLVALAIGQVEEYGLNKSDLPAVIDILHAQQRNPAFGYLDLPPEDSTPVRDEAVNGFKVGLAFGINDPKLKDPANNRLFCWAFVTAMKHEVALRDHGGISKRGVDRYRNQLEKVDKPLKAAVTAMRP